MHKYQVAGVVALGAAMIAATLIVGLGVDGRKDSRQTLVNLGAAPVASPAGSPTGSPAAPPPAVPKAAGAAPHVETQKEAVANVTVTMSGSINKDKHTLKVVSAHGDLTGQRELAWAADAGHAVGAARCTQNFRINPQSKAGIRPTMLLCWRTSATKSVYTLAVDIVRKPSERASVAKLNAIWNAMP
jgi:hypothetical protein